MRHHRNRHRALCGRIAANAVWMAIVAVGVVGVAPLARAELDRARVRQIVQHLEDFVVGQQSAAAFLNQHGSGSASATEHRAQTLDTLRSLRRQLQAGQLGGILLVDTFLVRTEWEVPGADGLQVDMALDAQAPHGIVRLEVQNLETPRNDNPHPLTWESLEPWMDHEGDTHFTGAVLIVRDGKPVLRKGYGWANEAKRIRNTPETIFAIGSTPIDFTIASILHLQRQGRSGIGCVARK